MKAFVSGQSGVAVLNEGEHWYVVRPPRYDRSESRFSSAMRLLDGSTDIKEIRDIGLESVRLELEAALAKDTALQYVLVLLEETESGELQQSIVERLEKLLSLPDVKEFVFNRLYAAPLARSSLDRANALLAQQTHYSLGTILKNVVDDQEPIGKVRSAWERISTGAFRSPEEKDRFFLSAVEQGLVRRLTRNPERVLRERDDAGSEASDVVRTWATAAGIGTEIVSGNRSISPIVDLMHDGGLSPIRRRKILKMQIKARCQLLKDNLDAKLSVEQDRLAPRGSVANNAIAASHELLIRQIRNEFTATLSKWGLRLNVDHLQLVEDFARQLATFKRELAKHKLDEKYTEYIVASVDDAFQRLTEQLGDLASQLLQDQELEAIGKIAGAVGYDFNNLLTIIRGYSNLLLDRLPDTELRGSVERIDEAALQAAALTNELIVFSHRKILQPNVINVNTVVMNLNNTLRLLIGADVEMITVVAPDLGSVRAEPADIEHLVMNLAANARDAMPKGGKLTLETANVDLKEGYALEQVGVPPGRYVMLAVTDTGVGMDAEMQTKVFEPFFSTKAEQGTGLGLYVAYGIVKRSGGGIWIHSDLGRGTTIKVYFPWVYAPVAATRAEQQPTASLGGSETILLVEEDQRDRELTRAALSAFGYSVLVADNPLTVNSICEQHTGPIDLLLTDVVMPAIEAHRVASQVMALKPGIRVLYVSGYGDHAIELDAGTFLLSKPFTPQSLAAKVREILDKA